MKRFIFVSLIVFFAQFSIAQTVLTATSQGWVGGVCCVSGINYNVVFDLPNSVKTFEVDSVFVQNIGWMSSTLYLVNKDDSARKMNVFFQFGTGEMDNEYVEKIKERPKNLNFEGAALLVLKINGKRVEKIITSFEQLQFLAYP